MEFKLIYNIVEELKDSTIIELLKEYNIEVIYDDSLCYGKESRFDANFGHVAIFLKENIEPVKEDFIILHELGHFFVHYRTGLMECALQLRNLRQEEKEANLFASLYLLKNNIWNTCYYDIYLMSLGVPDKIALYMQDNIFQYKQSKIWSNAWKRLEC